MKVSDLMTKDVVTVAPDTSLKEVAELFVEHGISGLPVVEGDAVVGVLSERDFLYKERSGTGTSHGILKHLRGRDATSVLKTDARTARDAMTSPPVTIASGRPVADAARLMLDKGVSRLPVVDSSRLVGIVTESDLVRAFARTDQEIRREIREDAILATFWESPDDFALDVQDGHVTIKGKAASNEQAAMMEKTIRRVPGVVAIDAKLGPRSAS